MKTVRVISTAFCGIALFAAATGCSPKAEPYGREVVSQLPGRQAQVWAVAPAVNLSGMREVDPLLQADLLFHKLQEVRGLTVVPVDRVVQVYAAMRIEQVQSPTQAQIVCEALGADALIVPTVTAYDPYDPPKWGGALQMFRGGRAVAAPSLDLRDLARSAAPQPGEALPTPQNSGFVQAVGMFDAANGTVREALGGYAKGRHDPTGPMGEREYEVCMDRYVGFAYHSLIGDLLRLEGLRQKSAPVAARSEPLQPLSAPFSVEAKSAMQGAAKGAS